MNNSRSFLSFISTVFLLTTFSQSVNSQCVWQDQYVDGFEYTTVIPGYIAGTTYHPSPSTYAPSVRTGSRGFYMNFVNGLAGNTTVLSRSYAVCPNNQYRFKAWMKQANGGSSTVTVRVRDNNNVILTTYTNTYTSSVWALWTSPIITPTTGTIFFEIIYVIGTGNNDFAMDDLSVEICAPPITTQSLDFCSSAPTFDLYDSLTTLTGTTGVWTGPSVLANGYVGTFDPTFNTVGTYEYTIADGNPVCPDSIESFAIVVGQGPLVDLGNDTNLCTNDILTLDVTNDGATYLWQDNSTDSAFTISTPGTYWVQVSDSCSVVSDTIVVQYFPYPTVSMGNDTVLCNGDNLPLDVTTPNASYLWSTNEITSNIVVQNSGNYWVAVTVDGCTTKDTIQANFAPMPSVNLGNDTTLCQGESIVLQAANNNATYEWQNGSTNPIFFVSLPNVYWVEVSINNCVTSDTIVVDFILLPTPDLGNDTTLCDGETLVLNAGTSNSTYLWQDNSTDSTFSVTQQGTYSVTATNICAAVTENISVSYNPIPVIDLGNDLEICEGLITILDATTPNGSYLWNDNSTLPTLTVVENGLYSVSVTVKGCEGQDEVNVGFLPTPIVNLGNDSIICVSQPVTLDATNPSATYLWMDNSTNATLIANSAGAYWVHVSIGPCVSSDTVYFDEISCNVIIEMPNIFTPNGDGVNDLFGPVQIDGVASMTTTIFSRWGNEMFTTSDTQIKWDGTGKSGSDAASGVYFWVITVKGLDGTTQELNGNVTLVR